jgi:hypothetical protein
LRNKEHVMSSFVSGASFSKSALVALAGLVTIGAAAACSNQVIVTHTKSDAGAGDPSDTSNTGAPGTTATTDDAGSTSTGKDGGAGAKDSGAQAEQPSCAPSGFCTLPPSSMFTGDSFMRIQHTADGTTWAASYGAYKRAASATTWQQFDLSWKDPADSFLAHDELYALAAFGANDAWVAGAKGYTAHFDGVTFNEEPNLGYDIYAIGGVAAHDMWLFDASRTRFRNTGSGWVSQGSAGIMASGVLARATNDVWAFGVLTKQGTENSDPTGAMHWNGMTWSREVIATNQNTIGALWFAPDGTGWAIAASGSLVGSELLRYDGKTWATSSGIPQSAYVTAISGTAANDVWVTADAGNVYHYDGASWTAITVGTQEQLLAVHAVSTTEIVIGGSAHVFEKK